MAIEDILNKLKSKEKEREEEEKEASKEEKKNEEKGRVESQQVKGANSDIEQKLMIERQINLAVSRFLANYPFLSEKINQIQSIAEHLLLQDYNSGNVQGDFYSYLVRAWEIYKKSIENEYKNLQKIPVNLRTGKEEEEERFYTMDDYKEYFAKEYLPEIKRDSEVIETHFADGNINFERGRKGVQGIALGDKEKGKT